MHYFVKDITGEKYGLLTVIEYHSSKKGRSYWKCKCDCGGYKICKSNSLRSKDRLQSCGCLKKLAEISSGYLRTINLEGKIYNSFQIIRRYPDKSTKYHAKYECKCNCGNIFDIWGSRLKNRIEGCENCVRLYAAWATYMLNSFKKLVV